MTIATIRVSTTPPSINTNAVRSHWRGFHTAKKTWQAQFETLLMQARVPRPIPAKGPVAAVATLTFPMRRRRDGENFRPVLSKALGDALVNGGWLDDDTDQHWWLRLTINPELGPQGTVVELSWQDPSELRVAA